MYEELVERLKIAADWAGKGFCITPSLCLEAADAIEEDDIAFRQLERDYKVLCGNLPKWIPVTETLPEKYTAVLAAGNGEVACGLFVGFAEPAHVASWDLDNVAAEPVTHWMPLPEPPKEG